MKEYNKAFAEFRQCWCSNDDNSLKRKREYVEPDTEPETEPDTERSSDVDWDEYHLQCSRTATMPNIIDED